MKKKIFISYCSEDIKLVEILRKKLQFSKYFKPIIVADRKEPMSSLSSKVETSLQECDIIIPILTEKSIYTQWINQEIGYSKALKTIEIIPLVQRDIVDRLKGFIHKQVDLSHSFELNEKNFNETIRLLVSFLNSKYKPSKDKHINSFLPADQKQYDYGPFSMQGWNHQDIEINIDFMNNMIFFFQIERSHEEQEFHIYYKLNFERGYRWIGFKPKLPENKDYTDQYESTKTYSFKGFTIVYKELIKYTINDRQLNELGKPVSISVVRMRASDLINSPVKFSFSFNSN